MKEKSAFDILVENLIDLGYEPETNISNRTFIIPGKDRLLNTKFIVCMLSDSIYFLASDSYGTRTFSSSTYTGLYSTIELPENIEYKIIKKDWFDFVFRRRIKTNISYIDNNLTVISSKSLLNKELSKEDIDLFLRLNKGKIPYTLVVESNYCPKIDALKDKKVIGLETNVWVYKKEDLKSLIGLGEKLIINVKNISY